jgi:DNA-binding CsgD family transcriptional regulator
VSVAAPAGGTITGVAPISTGSPLVGRTRELARLEQLLEQALTGPAAGVLVAGDAGVGKTRLTAELVARARERGFVAVVGHCVDLGAGGLPYLPFAEALVDIVRSGMAEGATDVERSAAAAVRETSTRRPVLQRLTGRVEQLPGDDTQERMPLYEAVLGALHAVTDDVAPVLLVLEDLHWADASTRDLLRFVLARLSDERLLVVGTYRTDDLHRRHPLRPLLAELVRLPRVERLDVAPFDGAELAEYLRLLHGGEVSDTVVEDIRSRSEGNAYYAEELLAAADAVPQPRGHRRVALPEQLADVLLARLEGLPPAVQQIARVASVAGRRVPDPLLRAASGLPPAELDEALREAVAHHVLVPDGADRYADRYAFRHALLQEAVYGDLLPGERVRLHATYARLLATGDGASATDLARHAMAAHDLPAALAAWVRAADEAVAVLAPAEALAHYEQALQLWPAVPEDARPPDADLPGLTLRAAAAAGAAAEHDRAVALAREAVVLSSGDVQAEAGARSRLVHHLYDADRWDDAEREAETVRDLLAGQGPSPVRVWTAAIQARMAVGNRDLERVTALVEPAVTEARELGLASAEADLLISLAVQEGRGGDVEASAQRLGQAHDRALAAGDPAVALRAVFDLGINRVDSGDLEGARTILERGLAEAERAGLALTLYGTESLLMLLQALVLAGEWDDALAAEARLRARAPAGLREGLLAPLLQVHVARDPLAGLSLSHQLGHLAQAPAWGSHIVLAPRADAQRWLGDVEGAVRTTEECLRIKVNDEDPWGLGQLVVLALGIGALADGAAAARLRDELGAVAGVRAQGEEWLARAREVARRGRPRLGQLGPEGRAWLARAEAESGRLSGEDDPAAWRRTVDAFGFGHRYEIARSRRHLAEALAAAGDRDEAGEQVRLARETAVALRARPLRDAVDALARRARLDLGSGPAAASVLTPREQEVMRLVAQGLTNRQIGRRLFISEKTASVHVSNVLAKLGAGGRTEAVAIAHRRGLLADPPG